ncbi:phage tail protein [Pseudomonas sp. P2757]|uniref:phage tail protein n=1 Tax=unclassified Pseudomonas TaxID=196821 RepID=UPI003B5A4039
MKTFYSQSQGCTYLEGLHAVMPADAVPIDMDRMLLVIGNPEPGKVRAHDESGLPVLVDPPVEYLAEAERSWRDEEIQRVLWLRERHRDEMDRGRDTTLSVDQFGELLDYIQLLRDWPARAEFPDKESRPVTPEWVANQAE